MVDGEPDNLLLNPFVRHGMSLFSAAILAGVAFLYLDGQIQLLVYGIAVFELLVTPVIMKRAGEQAATA